MLCVSPLHNPVSTCLVPIPGGCTLTSALDTDPNLFLTLSTDETSVLFQDGDTGFYNGDVPPVCDGGRGTGVQSLEYHMHNKYLPPRNYDPQELFNIIEQMLTPQSLEEYDKVCLYWGPLVWPGPLW